MKASPLHKKRQRDIGKWADKHPELTYGELAERYNCTYNQARAAVQRFRAGQLDGVKRVKPRHYKGAAGADHLEVIQDLLDKVLAMLQDDGATGGELNREIERLLNNLRQLQNIKLEGHLKRPDAGLIRVLIRMYEPNADEDRIITRYREAQELWKAGL